MSDDRAYLLLKWGTVKEWGGLNEQSVTILQRWAKIGYSLSAMTHHDTAEQKEILYEFINQFDGEISSDWSGEKFTKEQAIAYIRDYGTEREKAS